LIKEKTLPRIAFLQNLFFCKFLECPPADDGMERFACPTPDNLGRYRCVDDHVLCDGFVDCPGREDEDRQACMFYKTVSLFASFTWHYLIKDKNVVVSYTLFVLLLKHQYKQVEINLLRLFLDFCRKTISLQDNNICVHTQLKKGIHALFASLSCL